MARRISTAFAIALVATATTACSKKARPKSDIAASQVTTIGINA